jgi:prophage maintenance system killer protein
VEAVIEINRAVVAITGEPHFLRDPGLLEGALARSRNAFAYGEEDIAALASGCLRALRKRTHLRKETNAPASWQWCSS